MPTCDVRRLPLTPSQAYVLSRIDGSASVIELSLLTGLGRDEVESTLLRLVELGAVSMGSSPSRASSVPPEETSKVAAEAFANLRGPVKETYSVAPAAEDPKGGSLYDPSELDEEVDIPHDRRRRILDLYYGLDDLTHYELLGVGFEADKKQIKDAYFALAAELHPDRYFRKNVGSFKTKMEAVFTRITLAHDTLTKKVPRAEYDAYIETRVSTRKLEASMQVGDASGLESIRRQVESRLETSSIAPVTTPPPVPSQPPVSMAPAGPSSVPVRDPEQDRRRREMLARRLMGGRPSKAPGGSAPAPAPASSREAAENAAADLKRRWADKQAAIRRAQLKEASRVASEAMAREDYPAAANALALAAELAPDDEGIKQQLAQAQDRVARALAQNYLKQARYEERAERWKDAARSYTRVAETLRDNAQVQERAANAIVKSEGDLHAGGVFGRRAVELEPKRVEYRVTLARVYISGGLVHSARKELEIAAAMSPGDDTIAQLLKTVR